MEILRGVPRVIVLESVSQSGPWVGVVHNRVMESDRIYINSEISFYLNDIEVTSVYE